MHDLLTPERIQRWAVAFAVAMIIAVPVITLSGSGREAPLGGELRGDFVLFRTAGAIVAGGGDPRDVWDPDVIQRTAPDIFERGRLAYPYPPHLALLEAPLSRLPYRMAFLVHASLMVAALVVAARLIVDALPRARSWRRGALAAVVGFPPLFLGAASGQNGSLTLLLVTAGITLMTSDPTPARTASGGLVLSLLAYKPQFAVVPGAHLLLGRRHSAIIAWAGGLLAFYLVTVPTFGWDWPAPWLRDGVGAWDAYQTSANAGDTVSPIAVARTLGAATGVILLVGMLAIGLAALTARRWPALNTAERIGAVAVLTLLLSPSALWYELGLCLPALGAYANRAGRTSFPLLLGVWAASWLTVLRFGPANPGLVIAILAWWLCVRPTLPPPSAAAVSEPPGATPTRVLRRASGS